VILMLIELKPSKRIEGAHLSAVFSTLGQVLSEYMQKPAYQDLLGSMRISFDWVQYRQNFRPPIAELPVYAADRRSLQHRELHVDLRQVDAESINVQVRQCLERWAACTQAQVRETPTEPAALMRTGEEVGTSSLALAARPVEQRAQDGAPASCEHLYLEPFQPARHSIIWSFNALYWNALDKWESTFQQGYETTLPGGVTDACNPEFVAASASQFCQILDDLEHRGQLPEQIFVLEIGVGNGAQARSWLDTFAQLTRQAHRHYYDRLHYLMSDFSTCVLDAAREAIIPHLEHVSFLVLDASDPLKSLAFLRYKLLFVHISNVYDNLPSSELIKYSNRYYQVETRAYLPRAQAAQIAQTYGFALQTLGAVVTRFLKIGPDYFDEIQQGVHFWSDIWHALKLEERYVELTDLQALKLFDGLDSRDVQALLEEAGDDVRIHLNEMVLKSFLNTLPLLHPRGIFQVQDIFVTDLAQYHSSFRGPGKYDGSVVNWVNGPLLRLVGNRYGYEVRFHPFTAYRKNSHITVLTTSMRD
jgi:hypothetical protein